MGIGWEANYTIERTKQADHRMEYFDLCPKSLNLPSLDWAVTAKKLSGTTLFVDGYKPKLDHRKTERPMTQY